jgi:polysaccharide export outer membrane protein
MIWLVLNSLACLSSTVRNGAKSYICSSRKTSALAAGGRGYRGQFAGLVGVFAMLAVLLPGCGGETVQQRTVNAVAPDSRPYTIGKDDVLEVMVWKQPELSGSVKVANDGTITEPLVGRVKAVGLTPDQLAQNLRDGLSHYTNKPEVTVRVTDAQSQVVYILGQVHKPGVYQLHSDETLSEALAEAGGLNDFADMGAIEIVRRNAGGEDVQFTINYKNVASGADLKGDMPLQRGDTITVP